MPTRHSDRPFQSARHPRGSTNAFTLVELLVVIGVIALLISILLPTLSGVRQRAVTSKNLSNLRQMGLGLTQYLNAFKGFYPRHSSPGSQIPRTRWVDDIYPFVQSTQVYLSPHLNDDEKVRMNKPFAHTIDQQTGALLPTTEYHGGYGYNYHYLGNARTPGGVRPFFANASNIRRASETVAVADTEGSKNGGTTFTAEGVYTIDPPLSSHQLGSRGSRRNSPDPNVAGNYAYSGGSMGTFDGHFKGDPSHRSTPAERNSGRAVGIVFCDGHVKTLRLKELDDSNNDGVPDNGLWNGKADAGVR